MAYEQIVFFQEHRAEEALTIYREAGFIGLLSYLMMWHYPGEHDVQEHSSCGTSEDIWYHEDGYVVSVDTLFGSVGLEYVFESSEAAT